MRLLYLADHPPAPDASRLWSWVEALAERHEISVVCLCASPEEVMRAARLRARGVRVVPALAPIRPLLARLRPLPRRELPLAAARVAASSLPRAVEREVERLRPDLLHVEGLGAAYAALGLEVPILWDAVRCESRVLRQRGLYGELWTSRLAREERRVRVYEWALLHAFAHALVVSPRERALLRGGARSDALDALDPAAGAGPSGAGPSGAGPSGAGPSGAKLHVLPDPVRAEVIEAPTERRFANRVAYCGALTTAEETRTATWVLGTVMALVWRARPDATIAFAAERLPGALRAWAQETRVRLLAPEDGPWAHLASSAVAISAPGSESARPPQLLEALALGAVPVATAPVVGALGAVPERDLLLATTPERIAGEIVRLMEDDLLRARLRVAGRRYIERQHAPEVLAARLERLYTEITGEPAATAEGAERQPVLARAG